jgi:hypothetical protein
MIDASQRQPEAIMMREEDELLISACCRYQFLTIVDMAYLLGLPSSLNYVRRIATRLAGHTDQEPGHYLYRFPLTRRGAGSSVRVFVPGQASRTLLHQKEDADRCVFNKPAAMERYSYSFVSHNLAVTRLCICAGLFCAGDYYLVETRLSYDMTPSPPRVSLTMGGKTASVPVIPDCWLFIERVADSQGTALWWEVDNATTYREAFHRRLAARLKLITSEAYFEYFGTDAAILCYAVLGNETRVHTLAHWTWELLVRQKYEHLASRFLFTAIGYETLYGQIQTLFRQPVWRLPADRDQEDCPYVALFPPPQDKEQTHGNSQTTDRW